MMASQSKLTFLEKLDFVRVVVLTVLLALWTVAKYFLQPNDASPGLGRSVYTVVFKSMLRLPTRERKLIMRRSTGEAISNYCMRTNILHTVDNLPQSTKLHWVGPRLSEGNILLYFHGGGYNEGLAPKGHVRLAMRFAANASASLAMLEYTLAPTARYPTQLQQAVVALKYILASVSPSKVIIAGDSAGGHLAAVLLSHLNHPSGDIEPLRLSEPLRGICLISPFLSFDYKKESYQTLADYDYLTLEHMKELNENFKPIGLSDQEAIRDPYLSPLDAPQEWWKNSAVSSILLVVGSWEVFLDDCVAFRERLQEAVDSGTKVDLVQCSKEVHAACVADQVFGLEYDSTKTILAWMSHLTS